MYVIQSSPSFLWKNIAPTVKTKQIDNGAVCLNFEPFLLLLLSWETLILIAHSIGNEKVTTTYAASCIIGEREMGVLGISFSLLPSIYGRWTEVNIPGVTMLNESIEWIESTTEISTNESYHQIDHDVSWNQNLVQYDRQCGCVTVYI